MIRATCSALTGFCIGTDRHNDLIMVKKSETNTCIWQWQGNSLVNKAGQTMELEASSRKPGTQDKQLSIPLLLLLLFKL